MLRNCSRTFPFESTQNIERIAVSPDESLMIAVDKGKKLEFQCNQLH